MVQKVKDVAGNKISHVFDTISGSDTQPTCIKVLAEDKPGKVAIVLPHVDGVKDARKDVQVTSLSNLPSNLLLDWTTDQPSATVVTIFTSYGFSYIGIAANDEARRALSAFLQKLPGLVKDGKLKHIPVKNFDGGLEKVVSDGFEYIATGKVSAEKIVFGV